MWLRKGTPFGDFVVQQHYHDRLVHLRAGEHGCPTSLGGHEIRTQLFGSLIEGLKGIKIHFNSKPLISDIHAHVGDRLLKPNPVLI